MKRTFLVEIEDYGTHGVSIAGLALGIEGLPYVKKCAVNERHDTSNDRARVIDEVTAVLRGAQKRMKIDGEIVTIGGIIEAIEGLK